MVITVHQSDIGVRHGGDGHQTMLQYRRRGEFLCRSHPGHEARVAHELVDFPIVFRHGVGPGTPCGAIYRHIACHQHLTGSGHTVSDCLAMGMEQSVVHTFAGGVVVGRHGMRDIAAHSDTPVEVLAPECRVGGADIADGTSTVTLAEQRLAEAGSLVKLVAQTAVANHKGRFPAVPHLIDMADGEVGTVPAVPVAVGAVVGQTHSAVVAGAECG